MDENFYEDLRKRIKPYFEKTGSHSFEHTERVYNLAVHIAKSEKADISIIKTATLLHDIARKKQDEFRGRICHAEEIDELIQKLQELKKTKDSVEFDIDDENELKINYLE